MKECDILRSWCVDHESDSHYCIKYVEALHEEVHKWMLARDVFPDEDCKFCENELTPMHEEIHKLIADQLATAQTMGNLPYKDKDKYIAENCKFCKEAIR